MVPRFLTLWNYTIIFGILVWSATGMAQRTVTDQAPSGSGSYPPWAAPSPTPSAPPSGGEGDSFFVPVQPPSEGFDYFEDEEEEAPGSSGGGRSGAEGKSSFKLLQRPVESACRKWGNSLLGATSYNDKTSCEFELEKKVDQGRASIEELTDKIERFKLKKVIRGELKSRSEAGKYDVNFASLQKALEEASQGGCSCQ